MKTLYLKVGDPKDPAVSQAAGILRRGGLVAFPTETVYGLGASALNADAVRRIFAAKGRPGDNPLIVHIAAMADLDNLVREVPPAITELVRHFWPGPLTLVLRGSGLVPAEVTAGLETVAVRMPDHPLALALIAEAGVPVAAPSANTSGRPSPTTATHVLADLGGRIDAILDGGPCWVGVESSVLDVTGGTPVLLRPGGVPLEDLQAVLGRVDVDLAMISAESPSSAVPRAPGMKYRHYAPRVPMVMIETGIPDVVTYVLAEVRRRHNDGERVGVLATTETAGGYRLADDPPDEIIVVGSRSDLSTVAAGLFDALRRCDDRGLDIVLAEPFPETGLGLAIMNRLGKAAGYRRC